MFISGWAEPKYRRAQFSNLFYELCGFPRFVHFLEPRWWELKIYTEGSLPSVNLLLIFQHYRLYLCFSFYFFAVRVFTSIQENAPTSGMRLFFQNAIIGPFGQTSQSQSIPLDILCWWSIILKRSPFYVACWFLCFNK